MRTASSSTANRRSTPVSATLWHMGMSSSVRLAAMIPATWATASTSPLAMPPERMRPAVSADMRTRPSAWAVRTVGGFSVTSTMRARPWSLKCVSSMVQPPIRFMVRPAPLCPVSAR